MGVICVNAKRTIYAILAKMVPDVLSISEHINDKKISRLAPFSRRAPVYWVIIQVKRVVFYCFAGSETILKH